MSSLFKDFIPADEDPGAVGSGFKDFVPPVQPRQQVVKLEEVQPVEEVVNEDVSDQPEEVKSKGKK